jgi:TolB-like protein/DNA-binding SARP family transcriptional activator
VNLVDQEGIVLKLLGSPAVGRGSAIVTGRPVQGRRIALLSLVASARGRPVARDRIIGLLWPESPVDRARHLLSDSLYILRTGLGDGVIRSKGDELSLNLDITSTDVADFESFCENGQLERAVEIFGGPLLEGLKLAGAEEFERWLEGERERLGQLYADALEELARRAEQASGSAAAVPWWRRLASHDPYSGRIALRLMRGLDAAGDRAGALKHARGHAEQLKREFDAEPDREVMAFADKLRIAPPRSPSNPVNGLADGREEEATGRSATPGRAGPPIRGAGRRPGMFVVALMMLIAFGAAYAFSELRSGSSPAGWSLAVLPFVNLSAGGDDDHFSDGLTEQVISALSRIPELRVAARTSSFALRARNLDIRAIADSLDVALVLEGSVRVEGNRLRVTSRLIDATTGFKVWAGDYDRQMQQPMDVQDEVAEDIARALRLRMPPPPARSGGPPALPQR